MGPPPLATRTILQPSPASPNPSILPSPTTSTSPTDHPAPAPFTSKEWVVPPRPKPGRKPATQEPVGKRKAQNRDAQRAFRERRAAKVGDLEEQMKALEAGYDEERKIHQRALERLAKMEDALASSIKQAEWWRSKCTKLEEQVALAGSSHQQRLGGASRDSFNGQVTRTIGARVSSAPYTQTGNTSEFDDLRCSDCTAGDCACLRSLAATSNEADNDTRAVHLKRAGSPLVNPVVARSQPARQSQLSDANEIDFTANFARSPLRPPPATSCPTPADDLYEVPVSPATIASALDANEGCGFCSEGTHCACAEAVASSFPSPDPININTVISNSRPGRSSSSFTPPMSERGLSPVSSPLLLSRDSGRRTAASVSANPCKNGPGTCAQCQSDPRSTLFCKSLAAKHGRHGPSPLRNCCQSSDGSAPSPTSCCKPGSKNVTVEGSGTRRGTLLSCADTYTTLERHPNFEKALKDSDKWLDELTPEEPATGEDGGMASGSGDWREGKAPMEINAVKVLAVLGLFNSYGEPNGAAN